jgi:uncharacterized membrane protein YeaQ/YmgE (transglycosylase-associated protein family)
MVLLVWSVIGVLAGVLAHWRYIPENPGGVTVACIVGLGGALLGAYTGAAARLYSPLSPQSYGGALAGSAMVLLAYGLLMRRARR